MTLSGCFLMTFVILFSLHFTVQGQNCYYPNGDVAEGMAACTTEGGSCCPLSWSCLSDGLCYLDNAGYYGRYTCTDQDWASDSQCPNYCTKNLTAAGNEAVQHCADDSWCCDSNRDPKHNCCDRDDAEMLALGDASEIGFISSTSPPTSVSRTSTSLSSVSSTEQTTTSSVSSSDSSTSTLATPKATPTTVTTSAITSNSAGVATTIISIITSTPTPTSTPASAADGSNRSLVVGLGAGIPGVLLAAAAIGFLLWRLRRKRQLHEKPPLSEPPGLISMYRTPEDTPELDSSTLPAGKPDRKSELYGSTPSQTHHSPAISSVTTGSELPYYSPTSCVGPGVTLGQVQEEPSELWGSEIPAQQWPGQQPYRAPEPEQRMSQTFRVSQQDFAPYRPPKMEGQAGVLGVKARQPKDY